MSLKYTLIHLLKFKLRRNVFVSWSVRQNQFSESAQKNDSFANRTQLAETSWSDSSSSSSRWVELRSRPVSLRAPRRILQRRERESDRTKSSVRVVDQTSDSRPSHGRAGGPRCVLQQQQQLGPSRRSESATTGRRRRDGPRSVQYSGDFTLSAARVGPFRGGTSAMGGGARRTAGNAPLVTVIFWGDLKRQKSQSDICGLVFLSLTLHARAHAQPCTFNAAAEKLEFLYSNSIRSACFTATEANRGNIIS